MKQKTLIIKSFRWIDFFLREIFDAEKIGLFFSHEFRRIFRIEFDERIGIVEVSASPKILYFADLFFKALLLQLFLAIFVRNLFLHDIFEFDHRFMNHQSSMLQPFL